MSNTNFPIDESMKQLLMLNEVMTGKPQTYRMLARQVEMVAELRLTIEEYHPQMPFMLGIDNNNGAVPRDARPDWIAGVKENMQSIGAEYYDTVSKVFTNRMTAVLFYNYQGMYVVIASRQLGRMETYKIILACMLLEHSANASFVRRASEAIQNDTDLTYTEEELKLIQTIKDKERLQSVMNSAIELAKQERPTRQIERLNAVIRDLERDLQTRMAQLRELYRLDYSLAVEESQLDEKKTELEEYFEDTISRILDTDASPNECYYTVASYMQIPETDADFFKDSSLSNHKHPLYGLPNLIRLFKDVMEHKLRVPMYAHFRFCKDSERPGGISVRGATQYKDPNFNPRQYVPNSHITRYNCFHGYKHQMVEAFQAQNLIGVFEIMFQATGSINVFDDTVFPVIINHVNLLDPDTMLQIRTNTGWEDIRLEDYYEKIKSESGSTETTDS